ncbi:YjbE family putative metal transport protein [Crenobacter sp. SG2303]|uniref:YjbE family putative metal transport protein n=1 Tax=Crenobacter oryzisoli TaxID=3056844 RepID=A0ABT7XMI8_9NEIS|nr:YjbE family putative metal transport protein [Crenobacter sp. SG2303]MDN0075002.1 YjbE family putative metal transport protein [Crenobacter sp. SG2303]
MGFDSFGHAIGMAFQVFFLDLLLSGDNALVIALACRSLPRPLMKRAVLIGTGFAILLRVLLTTVVSFLLQVPLLRLIGAALLIAIAIKLLLGDLEPPTGKADDASSEVDRLWSAVVVVVSADLVLSLDNVVALAAAAQGSVLFLVLGLLFSVPLLMYGSLFITRLLDDNPLWVPAGSAMLGWIAGRIGVSDPLVAPWIATQAPALSLAIPLLCVVFVLAESRIIRQQRPTLIAPPPLGLAAGLMKRLASFGASAEETEATARLAVPAVALAPASPGFAAPVATVAPAAEAEEEAVEQADVVPVEPTSMPAPDPDADPVQSSRLLSLSLRVLVGAAALLGVLAIGWLLFHLASQGVLPTPEHAHG